jgi:hypothetical protein
LEFAVWGLGFGGLGFGVKIRVNRKGFEGLGFTIYDPGLRVEDSGFRF